MSSARQNYWNADDADLQTRIFLYLISDYRRYLYQRYLRAISYGMQFRTHSLQFGTHQLNAKTIGTRMTRIYKRRFLSI